MWEESYLAEIQWKRLSGENRRIIALRTSKLEKSNCVIACCQPHNDNKRMKEKKNIMWLIFAPIRRIWKKEKNEKTQYRDCFFFSTIK